MVTFLRDVETLSAMIGAVSVGRPAARGEMEEIAGLIGGLRAEHISKGGANSMRRSREMSARLNGSITDLFDRTATFGLPGDVALLVSTFDEVTTFAGVDIQNSTRGLGRDMLGAPGGASEWMRGDGIYADAFPLYYDAILNAEAMAYPELALAFDLVRLHMEDPVDGSIGRLLDAVAKLNERDTALFVTEMERFVDESWRGFPDGYSGRVRDRTIAFLKDYSDASPLLTEIVASLQDRGVLDDDKEAMFSGR